MMDVARRLDWHPTERNGKGEKKMGMFDYIRCQYPLPIEGANDIIYQTKDMTEWPGLNVYEIRKDGTIWREDYDIVNKGKKYGSSVDQFCGCMARTNHRWNKINFTGEIRFYNCLDPDGWMEWSVYFVKGQLVSGPHAIEVRKPSTEHTALQTLEPSVAKELPDLPKTGLPTDSSPHPNGAE
jgi:hypothetical protein